MQKVSISSSNGSGRRTGAHPKSPVNPKKQQQADERNKRFLRRQITQKEGEILKMKHTNNKKLYVETSLPTHAPSTDWVYPLCFVLLLGFLLLQISMDETSGLLIRFPYL